MLFNLKAQMNLKNQIHMFLTFLDYQELPPLSGSSPSRRGIKLNDMETACQNRGDAILNPPK